MRRLTALLVAAMIWTVSVFPVAAETEPTQQPAPQTETSPETLEPPAMPPEGAGNPPAEGEMPPEGGGNPPPQGGQPGMGGPGGATQPESYEAVQTLNSDTALTQEQIESTGVDESAVLIEGGTVTMEDVQITRTSQESTGGDTSSFYGVGAAVLATGGETTITGGTITTDAAGGAGVFAYGDAVVNVSGTQITTQQNTSGGIHVAGGGTLHATDLVVETHGESSAAVRSDRGGGTMTVDGGTYVSHGSGSPAVYVTADITLRDAALAAMGSEALCLEGRNAVRLYNCDLVGNMPDLEQNDTTWTVILYQSMSGDSEVGLGRFEMAGGTLTSTNGGLFYTTNTQSEFILSGVTLSPDAECEYLLRCTGNRNARGWGAEGANGADCTFTAIGQQMRGNVIFDSISHLDMYLTQQSVLVGAFVQDESAAGEGGDGTCNVYIDEGSKWVVTGDSRVTNLSCAGTIVDEAGNTVTIQDATGETLVEGDSAYMITVQAYSQTCDLSGAGALSETAEEA